MFNNRLFGSGLMFAILFFLSLTSMSGQDLAVKVPADAPAAAAESVPAVQTTVAAGPKVAPKPSGIKVVFDKDNPGILYIESNGERVRVDTTTHEVAEAESLPAATSVVTPSAAPATAVSAAAVDAKDEKKQKEDYSFAKGYEPYDYRLVNLPTPKHVPKGSWNLAFTHRFTQPINPVGDSAKELFGLDSFGVASFGLTYGVTDKLYVSAYRSPLCQTGICKTIELGVGYNWISHEKQSRYALSTNASIEGNDNFTEEFTYNLQARFSMRAGKRVYLFFSPAAHINANGQRRFNPRSTDFFPRATVADTFELPTNGASFGFGASVLITRNVVALFDLTPRTGFKLGRIRPILDSNFRVVDFRNETHPALGFGIQRNIGDHSFALTFSNTQATTTSRYNSSNLALSPKKMIIGFNLSRRF